MNETIYVPKTIKVGYDKRNDTYNGKLAYVTYIDEKGVHRKKASWDSWRDHDIDPDDFENEPLDGFVLNKKAGDEKYGWNPRQAWIRVYDPRGFELEISVNNLIYILENTNSIVGKGLEGKFVYGWSGKDHILIPEKAPEYEKCLNYSKLITNKFKKTDMVEGCIYHNKDMRKVIYLGHRVVTQSKDSTRSERRMSDSFSCKWLPVKRYIFAFVENGIEDIKKLRKFECRSNLRYIIEQVTEEPHEWYSHYIERMFQHPMFSFPHSIECGEPQQIFDLDFEWKLYEPDGRSWEERNPTYCRTERYNGFDGIMRYTVSADTDSKWKDGDRYERDIGYRVSRKDFIRVHDGIIYLYYSYTNDYRRKPLKKEEVEAYGFVKCRLVDTNGVKSDASLLSRY